MELSIKRVPQDIPKATGMQKERFKQQRKISAQQRKAMKSFPLTLHCLVITPRDNILGSPAQRLMARRTKTLFPISDTLLKPSVIEPSEVTKRLSHYRQQSKKYYDRTAKLLPNLQKGDVVRVTDIKGKYMKNGTVISETSYPRYNNNNNNNNNNTTTTTTTEL
ncbi:Hypothetical predicted protein [Paramuricea clavata]|uniref:Uncharacterized protein n=1 Tax=Paramuricea clavata TaxID=317549 RepID=A0A6S7JN75_PARCT|nr:Hypothetical predicted protein [Paramuricea clavata]